MGQCLNCGETNVVKAPLGHPLLLHFLECEFCGERVLTRKGRSKKNVIGPAIDWGNAKWRDREKGKAVSRIQERKSKNA